METPTLTLTQITLAATNLEAMAAFYNATFAADLRPIAAHDTTLYRGALHNVVFLLCPNSLAGLLLRRSAQAPAGAGCAGEHGIEISHGIGELMAVLSGLDARQAIWAEQKHNVVERRSSRPASAARP